MHILFHKQFKRHYKKLRPRERAKCDERISLFMDNSYHPILHNHALSGEFASFRSINITGDIRALYGALDNDTALFVAVGTHNDLYE